jgi:hypothetical protein
MALRARHECGRLAHRCDIAGGVAVAVAGPAAVAPGAALGNWRTSVRTLTPTAAGGTEREARFLHLSRAGRLVDLASVWLQKYGSSVDIGIR